MDVIKSWVLKIRVKIMVAELRVGLGVCFLPLDGGFRINDAESGGFLGYRVTARGFTV